MSLTFFVVVEDSTYKWYHAVFVLKLWNTSWISTSVHGWCYTLLHFSLSIGTAESSTLYPFLTLAGSQFFNLENESNTGAYLSGLLWWLKKRISNQWVLIKLEVPLSFLRAWWNAGICCIEGSACLAHRSCTCVHSVMNKGGSQAGPCIGPAPSWTSCTSCALGSPRWSRPPQDQGSSPGPGEQPWKPSLCKDGNPEPEWKQYLHFQGNWQDIPPAALLGQVPQTLQSLWEPKKTAMSRQPQRMLWL